MRARCGSARLHRDSAWVPGARRCSRPECQREWRQLGVSARIVSAAPVPVVWRRRRILEDLAVALAREALSAFLDAKEHFALHDKASRLHDEGVQHPGERGGARGGDAVPADQPAHLVIGVDPERPYPVPILGPEDRGAVGLKPLHAHARAPGADRKDVAGLEVLELWEDLV